MGVDFAKIFEGEVANAAQVDIDVAERGARDSIVESFGITGLHGYRAISASSPFAATVIIAKNGSGKTTLLGALNAFLRGQFSRLRGLVFSEIHCKIRGFDEVLVLRQEDVNEIFVSDNDSEIGRYARQIAVDAPALFRFLAEDYDNIREDFRSLSDDPIFSAVLKFVSFSFSEAVAQCDKMRAGMFNYNANLAKIANVLSVALKDIEVIYLPTYRRIELSLLSDPDDARIPRRRRPHFKFSSSTNLYTGDIQFGLRDILDRLKELNQTILAESNLGYRQISANIINELIDGTFERENFAATDIPDRDTLNLFFSRLKEGRRVGPYNEVSVPNLDKIYTASEFEIAEKKTLIYFLNKLNTVINKTRDIEMRVEDFINICNKYLSGRDYSVAPPAQTASSRYEHSVDDKILRLDRRNLNVHAESVPSGRKIPLDSLSSGEKQMISLFAKLYLYPKDKLVLIDEPELSLSIEWQRHILADVISAPHCKQLIAITHSPFVFDNPLDQFARSLQLAVDITNLEPSSDDEVDE